MWIYEWVYYSSTIFVVFWFVSFAELWNLRAVSGFSLNSSHESYSKFLS